MKRRMTIGCLALLGLVTVAGCAGDMAGMIKTNPEIRSKVMDVIGGNTAMAGQMVDKLLGADSTRAVVADRMFANGAASQSLMLHIAKDQTMLDGVLALAVQDTTMKQHVLTLLKGMEMAAVPPATP